MPKKTQQWHNAALLRYMFMKEPMPLNEPKYKQHSDFTLTALLYLRDLKDCTAAVWLAEKPLPPTENERGIKQYI